MWHYDNLTMNDMASDWSGTIFYCLGAQVVLYIAWMTYSHVICSVTDRSIG